MTVGVAPRSWTALHAVLLGALVVLGAVVPSAAIVWKPFAVGSLAFAALGLLVLGTVTFLWPVRTLQLSMVLLLLGGFKFRERDALATVSGMVDAQIAFELGTYGALFLVAFIAWRVCYVPRRSLTVQEGMLLGFVTLALCSAPWSPVTMVAIVRSCQLATVLFLNYVAVRVLGPTRLLHAFFVAMIVLALGSAAFTLVFPSTSLWLSVTAGERLFANNPESTSETARFAWFAMHPSTVGTFGACAALFVLAHLLDFGHVSRRWRRTRWFTFVLLVALLIAAHSRGPLAAFVAGLAVLAFWRIARSQTLLVLVPVVGAFLLVALMVVPSPLTLLQEGEAVQNPIAAFVLREEGFDTFLTLNGRTDLWAAMIPLILSRPILGYGYLAGRLVLMDAVAWSPGHAHNALLQTLLDLGLVGMLLMWIPVASAMLLRLPRAMANLPHVRRNQAIIASITTCVVMHSMADASFAAIPGFELFAVFTGIAAAGQVRRGDAR